MRGGGGLSFLVFFLLCRRDRGGDEVVFARGPHAVWAGKTRLHAIEFIFNHETTLAQLVFSPVRLHRGKSPTINP